MSRFFSNGLKVCLAVLVVGCAATTAPVPETSAEASPRTLEDGRERQIMAILRHLPPSLWKKEAVQLAVAYQLEMVLAWEIPSLTAPCAIYQVPEKQSLEETVARLSADHRVDVAEPVQYFRLLGEVAAGSYNDAHFHLQHGAHELGVPEAHEWATGRNVRVAVVDSGVDVGHPDLVGQIILAQNLLAGDGSGFTSDVHGTGIAGVIAARANNGEGIVGVAPGAQLLALKACWEDPRSNGPALCNSYTLARAIDLALRNRASVINLSLSGPEDPILERLLTTALEHGVTVVTAVDPARNRLSGFPASVPGVIPVGIADSDGRDLESKGVTPAESLVAPGVDILTTVPRAGYDFLTGSSLAAAHTSGVVALLLENRPGLTPEQVYSLVWETASNGTGGNPHGFRREVRACAALALELDVECNPP